MKLKSKMWVGILMAGLGSGCQCYEMQDYCDEVTLSIRNRCYAKAAWMECAPLYSDVGHPWHFEHGFCDGYCAVAAGGDGCTPPMPPRHYWKWHFQSPAGQECCHAWFDGYAHGALAAQQAGVGSYAQLPMYQPNHPGLVPLAAEHQITINGKTYGGSTLGDGGLPPAPADEFPVQFPVPPAPGIEDDEPVSLTLPDEPRALRFVD